MSRLTRAEQQRLTHEKLLAAGRTVLTRRGFLAATVEEIAEEAGYTRGAVYKHFGGKEGLWLALVDAMAEVHLQMLGDALARASDQTELITALTPNAFADDEDALRWSVTMAEFMVTVARRPAAAAEVVESQRRLEEQITALLERHCERLHLRPALPMPQIVVMLGALGGSLALRRGLDPEVDVPALIAGVLAVVFPEAG